MSTTSRSAAAAASTTAAAHDHQDDRAVDAVALGLQNRALKSFRDTIVVLVNKVYEGLGNAELESTYQSALLLELRKLPGVSVENELETNILYDGKPVGTRRADLVVSFANGSKCILELKAVKVLTPEHVRQLKYYMCLFRVPHGMLINFPRVPGFPDITDEDVAGGFTLKKLQGKTVFSDENLLKHTDIFKPEIHYVSNAKIVPPDAKKKVQSSCAVP